MIELGAEGDIQFGRGGLWELRTKCGHLVVVDVDDDGDEDGDDDEDGMNDSNMVAELRFVATVTTGGRVKFVPAV